MTTNASAAKLLTHRRIPVFVLTGFLGSGKTSLLVRMLRHTAMARTAVLVNEFGEVGIDQLTIRQVDERVRLLSDGCVCCTLRDDLIDALRGLYIDVLEGRLEPFERVVVETSGIADPCPIAQTLLVDALVRERFAYAGAIVTVDALESPLRWLERPEGALQAAIADAYVLTKADLAGPEAKVAIAAALREVHPDAPLVGNDAADVEELVKLVAEGRLAAPAPSPAAIAPRLDASARFVSKGVDTPRRRTPRAAGHRLSPVETFVLRFETPLPWETLAGWMERTAARLGPRLLRIKGVVDVDGQPDLVVVHAIRHLFHPADPLPRTAGGAQGTRIVIIVDNPQRQPRNDVGRDLLGAELYAAAATCEAASVHALARAQPPIPSSRRRTFG
jgi:G3E family GTPase